MNIFYNVFVSVGSTYYEQVNDFYHVFRHIMALYHASKLLNYLHLLNIYFYLYVGTKIGRYKDLSVWAIIRATMHNTLQNRKNRIYVVEEGNIWG